MSSINLVRCTRERSSQRDMRARARVYCLATLFASITLYLINTLTRSIAISALATRWTPGGGMGY